MDTSSISECQAEIAAGAARILRSATELGESFPDPNWQDAVSDKAIAKINKHFEALNQILSDMNDLNDSLEQILDILNDEYFCITEKCIGF